MCTSEKTEPTHSRVAPSLFRPRGKDAFTPPRRQEPLNRIAQALDAEPKYAAPLEVLYRAMPAT